MAIHLWPPVTRRLMRPTRGLGSAPLPRSGHPVASCALLFGLAPGGVCRVSLRRPTRRPGVGIVTVALVLVSRRTGVTRHPALRSSDFPHGRRRVTPPASRDHPTASLTEAILPAGPATVRTLAGRRGRARGRGSGSAGGGRRTTEAGPPAWARSIASLASASATLFWARGTCAAVQRRKPPRMPRSRGPQRDELGVLDPPSTRELLHDELGVEQQVDLRGAEVAGQLEGPQRAGVLGHVVGLDAEVVGDRGVGDGPRVARIRAGQVVQRGARATPARDCRAPRRPCG